MTAKEYLMQYRESIDRANELNAHLNELKAEAEQLKNHEGQTIRLDAAVAKYVDACDDAGAYLEMLAKKRMEIRKAIENVPNKKQRQLLREIYIDGKRLVQIAAERNQTYEHICRLHGIALNAVRAQGSME